MDHSTIGIGHLTRDPNRRSVNEICWNLVFATGTAHKAAAGSQLLIRNKKVLRGGWNRLLCTIVASATHGPESIGQHS